MRNQCRLLTHRQSVVDAKTAGERIPGMPGEVVGDPNPGVWRNGGGKCDGMG